jgi:hypothetical protein
MTVITRTVDIPNGSMRIRVAKLSNCSIGLIAIGFPITNQTVDVTCPQIDSNLFNRKRLLRRILFGAVNKNDTYKVTCIYKEFKHVIYEKVYSSDKFLDINFKDENGNFIKSREKVTIVLSIKQ